MIKRAVTILLMTFIFCVLPAGVIANGEEISAEPSPNQIEKLNDKIDTLMLDAGNNSKNVSENVIGLANLQMQLITAILAFVAIGVPIAAFLLRKEIKIIKDRAVVSVINMENEVNKIKLSEEAIAERKKKFDKLYADIEKKENEIDERVVKLKSMEGKPEEKSKLAEIEQEIFSLKRQLSRGIQPYAWDVSCSPSISSGYGSTGPTGHAGYGGYTPTTTSTSTSSTSEPFYPSPSPSPDITSFES